MTNEEKAKEIQANDVCCVWNGGCPNVRSGAMKMAQWKDEQFSKFLLWLDDFYVIRKFDNGEPMTYGELIDAFKNMDE
jgi:hypothetical protein